VIDGVIETDFPQVPEIIVFQAETSDVAWIPREGDLNRFYVRMDADDFDLEDAIGKINRAIRPHSLRFREIVWQSKFSVKESVAERFSIDERVFLAGDACHIHSVNGGQGLNTGIGDAFNLIWKIHQVLHHGADREILKTYEEERKPVALNVVETSAELVRSTRDSESGTHAEDYVRIVEKRSGYVTGMGVRYGEDGLRGSRLLDFEVRNEEESIRVYSLLDYSRFTLLVFSDDEEEGDDYVNLSMPQLRVIRIRRNRFSKGYSSEQTHYAQCLLLVRPDSYIEAHEMIEADETEAWERLRNSASSSFLRI
jgi:hypothetical protein